MTDQIDIGQLYNFFFLLFFRELLEILFGILELYRESGLSTEIYYQSIKKGGIISVQ